MLSLLLTFLLLAPPESPVEWLQEKTVEVGDTFRDEPISYEFRFRNVTDEPLLIDNVRVGCGCTATEWTEAPVAPGAEGSINVIYDSANVGFFRKYVKVFFYGHRGGHKLWMEGFVEEAD